MSSPLFAHPFLQGEYEPTGPEGIVSRKTFKTTLLNDVIDSQGNRETDMLHKERERTVRRGCGGYSSSSCSKSATTLS
jgi:hypothetical protein